MSSGVGRTILSSSTTSSYSSLLSFPTDSTLVTGEQVRRFELLRLAFFVLKLRKLEQDTAAMSGEAHKKQEEHALRCNLLRHAIFQQVITLTKLDARNQAYQLINTCRN